MLEQSYIDYQVLCRTRDLLVQNEWSATHMAADANGNMVPFWDTRVARLCMLGAFKRASWELKLPLCDRLAKMVGREVTLSRPEVGGWLTDGYREMVYFNDKVASSKEDVLSFLSKIIDEKF